MKKIIVLFVLLSSTLFAQEQTIFGNGEISNGGFGGPVVKFSSIRDQFAALVGGRGGWIINHSLVIGGGGYGVANDIIGTKSYLGDEMLINFGYGGFEMEYILNSDKVLHATVYLLIGAGGVSHRSSYNYDEHMIDNGDEFFVCEPAVNAELNILSFMRINIGLGYRYINGIKDDNLTDAEFSGLSGNLTFKFGAF